MDDTSALYSAADGEKYDLCKLLLNYGADINTVNSKNKIIVDIASTTGNQNNITLMKKYQNTKKVNKEVDEARKHLKALEIKQITEIKNESLVKIRDKNGRVLHLKQFVLENQQEKDNIEMQIELLIKQTNERIKQLNKRKNNYSPTKLLLEKQNTECEAAVNNMLDQITSIKKNICKYKKEIKTLEMMTKNYEQQKQECEFYKECLEEGKYDKIIKDLNKECPICFKEMQPPTKIFQCSLGHWLCENCFKKVSESKKTSPFCKKDVASNPVRSRALEEAIENEARRDVAAASRNYFLL